MKIESFRHVVNFTYALLFFISLHYDIMPLYACAAGLYLLFTDNSFGKGDTRKNVGLAIKILGFIAAVVSGLYCFLFYLNK